MWKATAAYGEKTRLYQWMKELGFFTYEEFHQKSIEDPAWFWQEAEKKIGFVWHKSYQQVLDKTKGIAFPKWYVDGKCNVVATALEKWKNAPHPALIYENEGGEVRQFRYQELYEHVQAVATGLQKQGLKKGDRVLLYLPLTPENIITFLSVVYCGGIVVPIFSGFGSEAVAARIEASEATFVVTTTYSVRRGKKVDMLKHVRHVLPRCPSVKKVIVVEGEEGISFSSLYENGESISYEVMESDDPFMLIYTSGTTGKPKGTVHIHSGFPIKAACDGAFGMDINYGDRVLWITDMGWMMGPFLVFATLLNGATMVLYDGAIDFPNQNRLLDVIQTHQLTHVGISPTLIRTMMNHVSLPVSLPSVRVFASTGEPWNPASWNWLFKEVGQGKIPIFNYSGGTEISGGILGNVLIKDCTAATFNAPLLGMAAHVRNEQGQVVENELGELCLSQPWVGMTKGFWQDEQRYLESYWRRFPDVWVHGDWVKKEQGYWEITGRSDDTLNIAGKRIGPVEYESLITKHPTVIECATIGIPDALKGEVACCFVVARQEAGVKDELMILLKNELGKALLPKDIHVVPDLPKTRNGKIMRRMIRSAYLGKDYGDCSSLVNEEALEMIKQSGMRRND